MEKEINKQKANFFRRKIVRFIIIPLLLFILWFGFTVSYIIYLDSSFSLISHVLPSTVLTHAPTDKLMRGDYISGKFVGNDDNLGILSLRFQTFFRPAYQNEDHLFFQIREAGKQEWYYENTYRIGTIYDVPFFPFGFPVIHASKGKTYEFKITSLNGNENNSVALSKRWQNVAAKYKFTKQEILQSNTGLLQFSVKKFVSSLLTIDVLFSSLVYILPLFFYLILISPFEKYLKKQTYYISMKFSFFSNLRLLKRLLPSYTPDQRNAIFFADTVLLGLSLLDGFYLQLHNSFVYLFVPIVWIITQEHFKFTSRKTIIIGISFLLLAPVFQLTSLSQIAENMAVWAFLFLLAGVIHSLVELKRSPEVSFQTRATAIQNIHTPNTKRKK